CLRDHYNEHGGRNEKRHTDWHTRVLSLLCRMESVGTRKFMEERKFAGNTGSERSPQERGATGNKVAPATGTALGGFETKRRKGGRTASARKTARGGSEA